MRIAVAKHGVEGLQKKVDKAKAKIEKKRKQEDDAEAYAKLLQSGDAAAIAAAFAPSTPATSKKARTDGLVSEPPCEAATPKVLQLPPKPLTIDQGLISSVRLEVRRGLKSMCNWDLLRSKQSPNGCSATVSDDPTYPYSGPFCFTAPKPMKPEI